MKIARFLKIGCTSRPHLGYAFIHFYTEEAATAFTKKVIFPVLFERVNASSESSGLLVIEERVLLRTTTPAASCYEDVFSLRGW